MWTVSDEFLEALTGSHEIVTRATAYFDGDVVERNLRVVGGTVQVDGSSLVRRTISDLKVASRDSNTDTIAETLNVYGTEVFVERGIRFPTGRAEYVPIGRFRVDADSDALEEAGAVTVKANDLAIRILDDRFTSPRTSSAGLTMIEQITRLVTQSIPDAIVVDNVGALDNVGRGIVWEENRLEAIAKLAKSLGAVFYCRPDGSFAIDPVQDLDAVAAWEVNAGNGGVLLGGTRERSRESVRNHVKVTSSSTSGRDRDAWAIAEDDDPDSPTYVGGPFGRVSEVFSSEHIRSHTQAQATADAILAKSLGLQSSLVLTSIVNPALEVGDLIDVRLPNGIVEHHFIDALTVPLAATDPMTITTRVRS